MPDQAPPLLEDAPEHPAQTVSPGDRADPWAGEIDVILADFRAWLGDALTPGTTPAAPADTPRLTTQAVLEQFLALRHEVNLQTKATRAQQEQTAESLRTLSAALDQLRAQPPRPDPAAVPAETQSARDDLVRPFLKTLMDLSDALGLAAREVQRQREALWAGLEDLTLPPEPPVVELPPPPPPPPPVVPTPTWWERLLGLPPLPQPVPAVAHPAPVPPPPLVSPDRRKAVRETLDRVRHQFEAVLTGYSMSLQRLERAFKTHDLDPIPAVGLPFDPEQMEVIDAVADSGRPAGEVLDEVRRGYRWRGRVFRYAQVRVAR